MAGLTQTHFPLFPLSLVVLPSELVPLHIFEERFRLMIEDCLESDREFGILWLAEEELKTVGCACRVQEVLERLEGGRLNIVVRGTRVLRLLERQDDMPYPAGVVEYLPEGAPSADPTTALTARGVYAELVAQATDRTIDPAELAAMSAYEMAATVDFGADAKQELLELRSETARLRLLTLLLRAAMKRLELIELAQARARSNGKVRFR